MFKNIYRYDFTPSEEEKNAILSLLDTLIITNDSFVKTAPVYRPGAPKCPPTEPVLNPQTAYLCEKLGIDDPIQVIIARSGRTIRRVQIENNQNEEKDDIIEQTPFKCSKLSLPAPITPSGNDEDASRETSACTPENSFLSISNTSDCITPPSATKKVFKRRNLAIYTPEEEPESDSSSSFMSTQSPRSSKIFCKNDL